MSWWNEGRANKRTLYVGGLDEGVDASLVRAAFVPFGEVKDVNIPLDFKTGKHRGFGFVEFELKEDALAAKDNMHCAEINGKTLSVSYAQPPKKGGLGSKDPVWANDPLADAGKREEGDPMQQLEARTA
ncbi:peptidyl-prolyl cis-trans isomerase E [Chloropicon primus]|nr:peptidyl-prolyl cis-trans isomerase E [Chloropicon primus]|mmetsp:Transcript_10063/g.28529  ORF Transcript_10063/g.28529 Transcript_10063/m.28529 type:complete len:129 (-) Transcript_10063:831-1217(-)